MTEDRVFQSDVLVVGGGMAGLFAAIKAAGQGASVTLVDKGYAGRSGSTPYAFWFSVFSQSWGHELQSWMSHINTIGEYVNNREWTAIVFGDSYDRFQDLLSWGAQFERDERGEIEVFGFPGFDTQSLQLKYRVFGDVIREQAVKVGVRIVDRVMLTDLLTNDGRVVGAMGVAVDSYEVHEFRAKATVMCSGGSTFKPVGWAVGEITGDGDMMAYRAGAVISGKEWNEIKNNNTVYPAATMSLCLWLGKERKPGAPPRNVGLDGPPQVLPLKGVNAEGEEILGLPGSNFMELEFEAHAGRAPVYATAERLNARVGGGCAGLSVHTCEGLWPFDTHGATNLPGLYAAGDSCCTMQCGAVYAGVGFALAGAAVTGARAGQAAGEYAHTVEKPAVDPAQVAARKAGILAPAERKGGFSPRWVTQMLQNTMVPYFTLYVKKGDRLQAALTQVEFMKDHLVPMMYARDPHELRLVHETKNMVVNAEAKLRASLFRTESRGTHYREDFPHRDDPDWLAWVLLKDEGGEMKLSKKPVPREWWPDLSQSYLERYPNRFPGEAPVMVGRR